MKSGSSEFADHFSAVAQGYATYRPGYPPRLFEWLAGLCPEHELAVDLATGNGQAARQLVRYFRRVIALDASAEQIASAPAVAGVTFGVAPAERTGLPAAGADLVTVAQALHWFDQAAFHAEVRRIARPGGVLAAWCYGVLAFDDPALDAPLRRFYDHTLDAYWPPERRLIDAAYRTLPFPFEEVTPPALSMRQDLTPDALAGYLGTWSAVSRYRRKHEDDPVAALMHDLAPAWGAAERTARWPIHLRVGVVDVQ